MEKNINKVILLLGCTIFLASSIVGCQSKSNNTGATKQVQPETNTEALVSEITENEGEFSSIELVSESMEWKYLDDLVSDPNSGTWYEGWNKRNGWAYPIGWLDWGTQDMLFDDVDWPTAVGTVFSTEPSDANAATLTKRKDGTAGPTYFFRHTFELENPEDVKAISGTVRYNDAVIIYLNGKPVESLFNIPISNYSENLQYGATQKVTEPYVEENFVIEDVSSLMDGWEGRHTIAVELHCSEEGDGDSYFELVSLNLNPPKDILPETQAVKNIAVNVGADETSLNFAWFALSDQPGVIQIAKGTDTAAVFPQEDADVVSSSQAVETYTKFYDKQYYSNKAVVEGLEPGESYIYRVGGQENWSPTYQINTVDISGGHEVIFLSDAQIGTGTIPTDRFGWKDTLDKAFNLYPNVSFIANTGDFVDVATKENEYDAYFAPEKLMSYPTASAVGNHDIAVNYKNHFNEPNASALGASDANSDYYFTYGNVLYMVLNTSNINHAEHIQFMRETVDATSNTDFDWKVVMFHQSIYASGKQSKSQDVPLRREAFVPVFDELGVDIVLMGHDHCYARTWQMKNFEPVEDVSYDSDGAILNPEGTLYLTMASASGSKYYDLEQEYDYLAFRAQFYVPTFSHLSFTKDTFTMNAYRTDTMEIIDNYTIRKTAQ
jgi:hypothetical protein